MSDLSQLALTRMTLTDARALLHSGGTTAEALTSACLAQINATEPHIGALLGRRDAQALDEARALDKEFAALSSAEQATLCASKPLWGIPVTIKDAITLKGLPTTAGSRMLKNFVPPYDAFVVERLRQAGAIILAKNNMDEFAMGSTTEHSAFHTTRNPWDVERVPGGSSGGSAASVAACQCFASLGSDTGGSIRQPASLCGCMGIKPTYGLVSRYGLLAYGSSLDQIGPLARSVEDVAITLHAIAGHDPRDSTSSPTPVPDYTAALRARKDLSGVRIGLPKEFMEHDALDSGVATACQNAVRTAQELGATLVNVSLPHTKYAIATYYILATAEAGSNLARYDGIRYGHRAQDVNNLDELYTRSRTDGFGDEVQRRILLGSYVLSAGYYDAYYRKAAQVRRLIRQDYDNALTHCDALLAPVSPIPAWKLGGVTDPLQMYLMDIFTLSLNLAGLPGLALPVGSTCGLPVGMQLMGRAFDESTVLSVGNVLANALKLSGQHAPL